MQKIKYQSHDRWSRCETKSSKMIQNEQQPFITNTNCTFFRGYHRSQNLVTKHIDLSYIVFEFFNFFWMLIFSMLIFWFWHVYIFFRRGGCRCFFSLSSLMTSSLTIRWRQRCNRRLFAVRVTPPTTHPPPLETWPDNTPPTKRQN